MNLNDSRVAIQSAKDEWKPPVDAFELQPATHQSGNERSKAGKDKLETAQVLQHRVQRKQSYMK